MLKENSLRDSAPLFVSCSNLMKQKAKEERRGASQHPGGYSHGKQAHVGLSIFSSASCCCLHKPGTAGPATPGYGESASVITCKK